MHYARDIDVDYTQERNNVFKKKALICIWSLIKPPFFSHLVWHLLDSIQCEVWQVQQWSQCWWFGFLERGDSRKAHGRLLMRPDETFSHIPGQSPGLQLATLLPAVQINKASLRGPPGLTELCQAKPGQTAHLCHPKIVDSSILTPGTRSFFCQKQSCSTCCGTSCCCCFCWSRCHTSDSMCVPERHEF